MSAPRSSITAIKRGLQAILLGPESELMKAVDALTVEIGDRLIVPPLRKVSTAELKTLADLPCAEVLAIGSDPSHPEDPWTTSYHHLVVIRFYVGGDDEERITEIVERYVQAARELFIGKPGDEARLWPFIGGVCAPGREDYDAIMARKSAESTTLIKAGYLELGVHTTR